MSAGKKGQTRKNSKSDESAEAQCELCKVCGELEGKNRAEEDKWVQCDTCESWNHTSCVDLTDKEFEVIFKARKTGKPIHWFCKDCNLPSIEILKMMTDMKSRQDKLEKGFMHLKAEVQAISKKVDSQLNEKLSEIDGAMRMLDKKFDERLTMLENKKGGDDTETFADLVTKQVDNKMRVVQDEVKVVQKTLTETKERAIEEQDKASRINNIIMYRVNESQAESASDRNKDDRTFAVKLLRSLNAGVIDDDIVKVFRLGQRQRDQETPRPLLVQFGSRLAKSLTMNNLYKLKHAEAKFRSVVVAHDMTQKERQECKELVNLAKQKNEEASSGDWVYKVRGPPGQMRIVRLRMN